MGYMIAAEVGIMCTCIIAAEVASAIEWPNLEYTVHF
jgi:hypothetical protein